MGARHRLLGVPGEERLTGMGVSYCATCDGAFFRDRTVAVVGGGDVAAEDAIFLARACRKVLFGSTEETASGLRLHCRSGLRRSPTWRSSGIQK